MIEEGLDTVCSCGGAHDLALVERSRALLPRQGTLSELSDFFKVLGDPTRLAILFAIDKEAMCVCDIAATLGMTKSAVSHQLKILRHSRLVKYERAGKNVFYELSDDHVRDVIERALEHINE